MFTPPHLPAIAHKLADVCHAHGGSVYLVGGAVRDHLLHRQNKDLDLEVFGIEADDLEALLRGLGRVNAVGRSFGVFKLTSGPWDLDVSLPRRDSKKGPGHRGIHVEGDPGMSLSEAARRRDLTINALMWDIHQQRLHDPSGGLEDLRAGRLRAVDVDAFLEDPLRAVRVVQFAARFEFTVDRTLLHLCRDAALHELPAERVREEWIKLLLKSARPSIGLQVAREAQMLGRLFPELVDDPAGDAALDHLAGNTRNELGSRARQLSAMLLTWLWTQDAPTPTLDRLNMHRWLSHPVRRLVLEAHAERGNEATTDAELRHLSTRCELELLLVCQTAHGAADATSRLSRAVELGIEHSAPKALLLGRHLKRLGVRPGPKMGEVLQQVYLQQLDGTVTTVAEAETAAKHLIGLTAGL